MKKRTHTLLYALFYAIDISTLPSGKIMPKSTSCIVTKWKVIEKQDAYAQHF